MSYEEHIGMMTLMEGQLALDEGMSLTMLNGEMVTVAR